MIRVRPSGTALNLLIAVSLVAAAIGLRLIHGWLQGTPYPFVTFYPAVLLAALLGGLPGGLLATALSGLAATWWMEPAGSIGIKDPGDAIGMAFFLATGVLTSAVCELMRRAQARALRAEGELKATEERRRLAGTLERYRLLSQQSRDIILFVRDDDGTILECNRAAEQAYGRTRDEMLCSSIRDILQPGEVPPGLEASDGAEAGILYETIHRGRDGSTFPVEVSSVGAVIDGCNVTLSVVRDISQRRQAQETLRASEATLRAILDAASESIWLFGADGTVLGANATAASRVGHTPAEVIGKSFRSLIPPDIADRRAEVIARVIETKAPEDLQDTRAGMIFEHRFYPVFNADGSVTRVTAFSRDVTARTQAEEARARLVEELFEAVGKAERSSAQMEAVYEAQVDAILLYDTDETVQRVNPAFESTYGFSPVGMTKAEIMLRVNTRMADGSPVSISQPTSLALSGKASTGSRYLVTDNNGVVHTVEGSSAPLMLHGEIAGAVTVWHDITDQMRAEEAARESEALYRKIIETANEGVWVVDAEGVTTLANAKLCEMLGAPMDDIIGRTLYDFAFEEDHERIARSLERRTRNIREQFGIRLRRADGSPLWTHASTSGIFSDGGFEGALSMLADISEIKQLEDELRRQAEALERSSRAKDEFLAMLSHELRNPLGAISNATHILSESPSGSPGAFQAMEVLRRNVRHTSRLVDDLLDVRRIDQGQMDLRREHVSLAESIRAAVAVVQDACDRKEQALSITLPDEPVWVMGDHTRLEQIIVNLLHNSTKYTPAHGRICVSLTRDNAEAVLEVQDNGIGISPEILPRVFDLFQQGAQTIDRPESGLGIGLTVARRLAELHGGSLHAHSDGLGQGTLMTLRLPIADPGPGIAAVGTSPAAAGAAHRRILVVDDIEDAADTLVEILCAWGHEASAVYDGLSAVDRIRAERPEAVMVDIGLPGLDGYEVARAVRSDPGLDCVHLFAVTGYGSEDDRRAARESGFNGHYVKPVDLAALRDMLGSLE